MGVIDGVPIVGLTAPSLLGLTILLLLTGRIIPRATYLEKASEARDWKEAYEAEREARQTSERQTTELLEVSKTTHHLVVSLFSAAEQVKLSGEAHALPKT